MDPVLLDVELRNLFGKKLGALRRAGITPLHVYGKGIESLSLQVPTTQLIHTLAQVGYTTPLTLRFGGDEHFVMVREVQRHPVSDRLLHVDLIQVSRTERMVAEIPITVVGEAPATRQQGVMLVQDLYAVQVEALPMDLPSSFTIDVSELTDVDMAIYTANLELPSTVSLVSNPESAILRIVMARAAEEAAAGESAIDELPQDIEPSSDSTAEPPPEPTDS